MVNKVIIETLPLLSIQEGGRSKSLNITRKENSCHLHFSLGKRTSGLHSAGGDDEKH